MPGSAEKQRFIFRIAAFANEESRARAGEHLAAVFPGRAPAEIGRALERTPLRFSLTATPSLAARLASSLAELGAALTAEPDPRVMVATAGGTSQEPLEIPLEPVPDDAPDEAPGFATAPSPVPDPMEVMRARLAGRVSAPPAEAPPEGPPAFFWYAWVDTLFSPLRLFASLRAPGGTFRALLFAATLGFFAAVLGFPAHALHAMQRGALDMNGLADRYLVAIFTKPLVTVVATILSAALVHGGLRLFSGPRPFEITLKVLAYTTAAAVFTAIPEGGPSIAAMMGLVLSVVGLTVAQRVRMGQAIGAILFPVLLAGGALILLLGVFLLGGLLLLRGLST